MQPLAHSARPDKGISPQLYADHITQVFAAAVVKADRVAAYSARYGSLLRTAVRLAAQFHDLGKLDSANQKVLAGTLREKLPINHWDAGVGHLFSDPARVDLAKQLAAAVIYAHHQGLPSIVAEVQKGDDCFRDCTRQADGRALRQVIDERLSRYLAIHYKAVPGLRRDLTGSQAAHLPPLLVRLALSCLVDADHADTARHYGNPAPDHEPPLRPEERLQALDAYVRSLSANRTDEKTLLRCQVYAACCDGDTAPCLVECDSPVGSGKTTAVMAHLLQAACAKKRRRLFVVLPFTNIIDQSVEIYRKCLVLPGEQPEEIVAAHHHRAEYRDVACRHFSALWHAPIVVTTAVQFFETLAGCHPAALRKLHQVAGSGVFIDESHASLPAHLWPQAWEWLMQLAQGWSCHFVFGSGSLNRIWQVKEFVSEPTVLPQLVRPEVRSQAAGAENRRIAYRSRPDIMDLEQLIAWLTDLAGPRLLIVNTVQTAAAIARCLEREYGRDHVEHLSTALTPRDRARALKRVKERLQKSSDIDWTLVATSCVEAGVDVSFRTGLRERASLTSLIQVGGRVNRSNEYGVADVWDFQLRIVGLVRENRDYQDSAQVLADLFKEGKVAPHFCTEALSREIKGSGRAELNSNLRKAESGLDFPEVERLFHVINESTVTVVIDRHLQDQLEVGATIDWRQLQQVSVQIYSSKAVEFAVRDFLPHFPDLKGWKLDYDDFLGYMAGVLPLREAQLSAFIA